MSRKLIRRISIVSIAFFAVAICVVSINVATAGIHFQDDELQDSYHSPIIAALAECVNGLEIGDGEDQISDEDQGYLFELLNEADLIFYDCKESNRQALQSISGEGSP